MLRCVRACCALHLLHAHALADLEEEVEAGAHELHGLGLRGVRQVLQVVAAHEREDLGLDERDQPLLRRQATPPEHARQPRAG